MFLTITYANGIIEEFALSLNSAQDLISRLIESGNVKEIKSCDKILYSSNKEYYDKVESLEFYAQAAENNCFGSGCCVEVFRKVTEKTKQKDFLVRHNDFVKMYDNAQKLRIEILDNVKIIDDRKELIRRCVHVMRTMQSYINAKKTS